MRYSIMARRFQKYQTDALKQAFEESERLTKEKKIELAGITGLDMEQVTSWFNRKRVRKRARQSTTELERVNTELKQSLQDCLEREVKLQEEVKGCKSRIADLQDENRQMKRRLTVPGGDSTLYDSVMRYINIDP